MWSPVFDIRIHEEPVPKGRPRAYRVGKMIKMYTPEKVRKYEQKIGGAVWAELKSLRDPLIPTGPIRIVVDFYHTRPKRLMRRKDPEQRMYLCHKPDIDNCLKSLMDGCNKAPLWVDDAQVCSVEMNQWRCEKGGSPRIDMTVYVLQEEQ